MFYIILLILLEAVLFAANYVNGTYLIGWDNVMPEFNLSLNFQRGLFSIWQEYRGLGLLDGMAHSANLFHTLYIFLLSLFLPQSALRYVFIFLTHLAGGIGMYYLIRYLLEQKLPSSQSQNNMVSFLGALFYMFNLGIIQMYYAPLEAFAVHFAALPLIALFLLKSLNNPNKKNYLLLFLTSLAFTPQSFITPLFIVFSILIGSLLFFSFRYYRNFKRVLCLAFIIFSANAFWLVPYLYSVPQNSKIIHSAKINELATDEIYYRNKAWGGLGDVLTFRGFMLDTYDFSKNKNVPLMESWVNHQNSIYYNLSFFVILVIGLFGLIQILIKRKKEFYPFLPPFFLALLFLANSTPVLEWFSLFIKTFFPVLGEAFRFPFTKFITLFVFCFSIFFAYGASLIIKKMKRVEKAFPIFLALIILFLAAPVFKGNFISPLLKTGIPGDYFNAFKYFDSLDKNQRVLILPAHTFWNWQYRTFGQRGSGFLWYGIQQPILERAFDPWSNFDEQVYNEAAYAINTFDSKLFQRVIEKYDIKYIFLDQYIQDVLSKQPINYDRLRSFLDETKITKEKEFGKIIVYETNVKNPWLYTLDPKTVKIYPGFKNEVEDNLSVGSQNYVVDNSNPDIVSLFPSLYSGKLQEDLEFEAKEDENTITLVSKKFFSNNYKNYVLSMPSLYDDEFLIPISITVLKDQITLNPLYPRIYINDRQIATSDEKIIIIPSFVKNPKSITFFDINYKIDLSSENKSFLLGKYPNSIKLDDGNSQEVIPIDTNKISGKSYLVNINESIKSVKVVIDKIPSPFSFEDAIREKDYQIKKPFTSFPSLKEPSKANIEERENLVNFEVQTDSRELVFYKDNLFHQASYILFAKTKYTSGLPINFYIDNAFENRPEMETRLAKSNIENVIIIPKTEEYFKGYGFHFIVKSLGTETAKSSIEKISFYPFPMTTLKNLRLVNPDAVSFQNGFSQKTSLNFEKTGNFLYKTNIKSSDSYLVLSQAYDDGWKAYKTNFQFSIFNFQLADIFPFIFGSEIKDHVLVNNWENGWKIDNYTLDANRYTLVIIFWPQYLEFAGFGILVLSVIFILFSKQSKNLQ